MMPMNELAEVWRQVLLVVSTRLFLVSFSFWLVLRLKRPLGSFLAASLASWRRLPLPGRVMMPVFLVAGYLCGAGKPDATGLLRVPAPPGETAADAVSEIRAFSSGGADRVRENHLLAATNLPALAVGSIAVTDRDWNVGVLIADEAIRAIEAVSAEGLAQDDGSDYLGSWSVEPGETQKQIRVSLENMPGFSARYSRRGFMRFVGRRDADSDGLSDLQERFLGTDPNSSDSDRDGLSDGWEFNRGLDPSVDDTERIGPTIDWYLRTYPSVFAVVTNADDEAELVYQDGVGDAVYSIGISNRSASAHMVVCVSNRYECVLPDIEAVMCLAQVRRLRSARLRMSGASTLLRP